MDIVAGIIGVFVLGAGFGLGILTSLVAFDRSQS